MQVRHYLRHLDYVLFAIVVALVSYGVVIIYLATKSDPLLTPTYYLRLQLQYAAIGFVALVLLTLVDYERFRRWQWPLYAFTVVSIAAVFLLAEVTRGSRRWIDIGFVNFQPSQLAIVLLTLGLGAFLANNLDSLGSPRPTVVTMAAVLLPAIMVFREPDLGTATVLVMLGLGLLFFFGTRWTHLAAIGLALVAVVAGVLGVLPACGVKVVEPYQLDRLTVFLDPSHDTSAAGYNVRQSLIAIGSGGLAGRGDLATQTQLQFLPEHHTDFIFAVAGERWGFLGTAGLIALQGLLIWRALRIAALARDMYGSIMAGGIATIFLYQILVNVGMTLGIMPVTGIPLPFVSYGGAALITSLMLVGVLESIHMRASDALAARERVG